jgi:hypothetical protein
MYQDLFLCVCSFISVICIDISKMFCNSEPTEIVYYVLPDMISVSTVGVMFWLLGAYASLV